ncbi:hypothetical protein [Pseudonocardia sp. ICBG601]|uniref:hypothetical protein n=1 Tax=Pseudonocardia sp. ICBG601 TaxID=2846759 RepID=UPI0021F6235F|nr:hypothetical protein [Pseudonocardia sp. ICBG601]
MTSGLPNKDKGRVRQAFAAGEADRAELLRAESASYHGPGPAPSSAPRTPTSC